MGSDRLQVDRLRRGLMVWVAALALLPSVPVRAQQPAETANPDGVSAADHIANAFSQLGDQIYDECIFELSEEQLEVQQALIQAYVAKGASSTFARQLAVRQIQPPKLSEKCEEIRNASKTEPRKDWSTDVAVAKAPTKPEPVVPKGGSERFAAAVALAAKKVLPQWDCASNVDFVTIKHKGYERKLTGGEICNPFRDVVHKVPDALTDFRLGYTIRTGRLFVISDDAKYNGKTIAWAISGREICRNNPDPDCLAARAVGPLPPGEYSFADKSHRLNWGPTSKRMVAGVYLNKLFDREKYTRAQTAAILARGNIAIHVRLKGEMSEACLGLEPDGWTYVSGLIKDGRATGLTVHVDEPHPQIAEKAPIQTASTFSLTSLFKSQ